MSPESIQEIDRPELMEIFADSLGGPLTNITSFDGTAARVTFCISRSQPSETPRFKRYPVARLVLTPELVVALFNQLNKLIAVMTQLGMIKKEPGKPPEVVRRGPATIQ